MSGGPKEPCWSRRFIWPDTNHAQRLLTSVIRQKMAYPMCFCHWRIDRNFQFDFHEISIILDNLLMSMMKSLKGLVVELSIVKEFAFMQCESLKSNLKSFQKWVD
jgi:hypothetical protein